MKALICIIAFIVPLSVFAAEPEAVVRTFDEYKSAILEQKGQIAVGLVTKRTIDQYQQYVDWALSADREELGSLSLVNRFQAVFFRHRIPADSLAKLDGQSLFVYTVDKDWVGKNSTIRTTLGKVDVANNRATAEVLIGGRLTPTRFQFSNENGKWKFDLVPILRDTDQSLQIAAKQRGVTENEFMFSLIETISGRKINETIWTPIQKSKQNKVDSVGQPIRAATNRASEATRYR